MRELPAEASADRGPPTTAGDSPRNRLAAEIRRLTGLVVGRPLDDDELERAALALGQVADGLEEAASPGKSPRGQADQAGHPQDFFVTSPIVGYANPLAPPMDVWTVLGDDGRPELRGRGFFGYPYEGPPTCVHGGVIAEVFDEFLGLANIVTGRPGMTGTLTVKYRKPTPLLTELDLVARQTSIEGRKVFAWGGIYHDGELTAEAEGIFVEVRVQQMLDIVTANARGAEGEVIDAQLQAFVDQGGEILGVDGPPLT